MHHKYQQWYHNQIVLETNRSHWLPVKQQKKRPRFSSGQKKQFWGRVFVLYRVLASTSEIRQVYRNSHTYLRREMLMLVREMSETIVLGTLCYIWLVSANCSCNLGEKTACGIEWHLSDLVLFLKLSGIHRMSSVMTNASKGKIQTWINHPTQINL